MTPSRIGCSASQPSYCGIVPPVEAPARRVVASLVLAGDAGLAKSCLYPRFFPWPFPSTPAEGAQIESLFWSKHQECCVGGARACGEDLPGIGHAVYGGCDPAPGACGRWVGDH